MYKAKKDGQQAKVIDHKLLIGDKTLTIENIPGSYRPEGS